MYQSLAHSRHDCKYHVVFIPKYRKSSLYTQVRKELGKIFHWLARQKECKIISGNIRPDHVHIFIEIPPKYAVASIIGFLKGKSAVIIARDFMGKKSSSGENFWARGYAASTVGFEEDAVMQYIRDQREADEHGRF